jgi:hypothetical protein
MTTYSYDISLSDSELIALEAALDYYEEHCIRAAQVGDKPSRHTHAAPIARIRANLFRSIRQTSGNNFWGAD